MDEFYTVLEVQNNGTTPAAIPVIYTDSSLAYNKYYTVLAAASVSDLPYHAAYIISSNGALLEWKVFDRRTVPNIEG